MAVPAAGSSSPTAQAPEGSAAREAAERAAAAGSGTGTGTAASGGESSEPLFGINTESTGLGALSVAVKRCSRYWFAAASVMFCVAAASLDLRKVTHQHALGQTGVMAAAIRVTILHILAGVAAVLLAVACTERQVPASTS